MTKLNLLFVHFGDQWIRGSERVLIDLINTIDKNYFKIVLWTNVMPLAEIIREERVKVYLSSFEPYMDYGSPKFRIKKYLYIVCKGIKIINRENIAVIHSNGAAPAQWLVPGVWWTNRPLLVHLHTTYLRRSRVVYLVHQADRVIGVARSVLNCLRQDGIPRGKLNVILNGINLSRFSGITNLCLKSRLGLRDDNFLLGGVGSLIDRKGWDVALRALSLTDVEVHFCIGGDGPVRNKLIELASDLHVSDRVHFLGGLNDPSPVYEVADVIIMPSRMEAFGLVAVEAGFFGKPVIASNVGGVSEVIQNGVNGLLIPPDEPAALANAIEKLRQDVVFQKKLGTTAKRIVESKFDAHQMAASFQSEYRLLSLKRCGKLTRISDAIRTYLRLTQFFVFYRSDANG
jgi:glycosyltransferase involved in cell wall biosynthesis